LSTTEARGAHPPQYLLPASVEDFRRRQDAADGRIILVTLAPEVTGGVVVAYLVDGRLKLPKSTPVFNIGDEETVRVRSTRKTLPVPTQECKLQPCSVGKAPVSPPS